MAKPGLKLKVQLGIVALLGLIWAIAIILAVFNGSNDLLKVITPVTTLAFGWLFAGQV